MSQKLYLRCALHIPMQRLCSTRVGGKSNSRPLDRTLLPREPQTSSALARQLASEVLYHKPGDVVAVNKPYGVSCLGYKQSSGGVFKSSRYDQRPEYLAAGDPDTIALLDEQHDEAITNQLTIERALPELARRLDEPGLHFCIGLKRFLSGPVILPCNPKAYEKIKKSFYHANSIRYKKHFLYHALAICIARPPEPKDTVFGYVTFQPVRNVKEYIFVPGIRADPRAISGKYAVQGELHYRLLAEGFGCSLLELRFTKFSRHLPRLILSHLGCPILGDSIYEQRLLDVGGRPVSVEPKDRWRGGQKHQYEPSRLMERLQIDSYKEIHGKLPLLLTVYQSNYPLFGDTRWKHDVDLVVRAPPPDHFLAMAKFLGFDRSLHGFLEALDEEDMPKHTTLNAVGGDRSF